MSKFNTEDYWKAIILYGLNASTYKIALGKTLINFAKNKTNTVSWEELSKEFLNQYLLRLNQDNPMPQLSNPKRRTVMEKIILQLNDNQITTNEAIKQVGDNAFEDVIPRFHMLGKLKTDGLFYKFIHGESLILTDELMTIVENSEEELNSEVDSRWNLLEGAFYARFSNDNYVLGNDILKTYLKNGDNHRKNLTGNIPFLQGYQCNICFYCAEQLLSSDIHVDHVLPRAVVNHDKLWNLVLAHEHCNQTKSDKLVGNHFIEKLIKRNENIIGSNHPWRKKLIHQLGETPKKE